MKEHFTNCPKNAAFTSKTIQDEVLDLCTKQFVEKCTTKVKDNGMFFILTDEAVDISNVEQMPIVARYVDINKNINERIYAW